MVKTVVEVVSSGVVLASRLSKKGSKACQPKVITDENGTKVVGVSPVADQGK